MFLAVVLLAGMTGQSPAPSALAPKAKATAPAAKARPAPPPQPITRPMTPAQRRRAQKNAAYARGAARDAADAQIARQQAIAAQRQYERMLPYMLEAQRLEYNRATQAERNVILGRMAGAMERSAGYVYPGQSPSVGPYPGPASVAPMNPLYSRLIPE